MFQFVYADAEGNGYIDENYLGLGLLGGSFVEPAPEEVIPLPEGASLTMIPDRIPVVLDRDGRFVPYPGRGWAMGALLPQGYTRTLLPAFIRGADSPAGMLPLFGYTAVFARDGALYAAAVPTDADEKWNPRHFHSGDLPARVARLQRRFPQNRLLRQLGHCALSYDCFTAQNLFYHRWEGGIPVSPICNARCLGCISLQPSECCPSPQSRLTFVPTVEEITELAVYHLRDAEDGIISFGQGCEGDPAMQAPTVARAIRAIRRRTPNGCVNMNTNAGSVSGVRAVVDAGIDSLRVSLNSAREEIYRMYYRPAGYGGLEDVRRSLCYAAEHGVYTYLNLLSYPGVNDNEQEIEALLRLVRACGVRAIQVRNLNIDPALMRPIVEALSGEALGVPAFLRILSEEVPDVAVGNYTKPFRRAGAPSARKK